MQHPSLTEKLLQIHYLGFCCLLFTSPDGFDKMTIRQRFRRCKAGKRRQINNFFPLQKNLKLLSSNEQYTSISLTTERWLTWSDQQNNWDNSKTKKKNPLSPNLCSYLFWLPSQLLNYKSRLYFANTGPFCIGINIFCSHFCGHSAQQRRIISLWDKIWHHKNLFSPVCFTVPCCLFSCLRGWQKVEKLLNARG